MRHSPYFISPISSAITAFADSYPSFEEAATMVNGKVVIPFI